MNNRIYKFLNIEQSRYKSIYLIQLYLIFLIGLLSIFVRYPMSWYDEQVHYARVLTYSNNLSSKSEGYITQSEQDFIHLSMTTISKSLAQESQKIISIGLEELTLII